VRRRLGASGVEVSPVGVGAWAWGDKFFWNQGSWGEDGEAAARGAFESAAAAGLNWVDTAEVYGTKQFGGEDSEVLLGRFLRAQRAGDAAAPAPAEAPLVATKFAALPWRRGPEAVEAALRASLERLQLEQVDLYQLHWPGLWGNEGYLDGLARVQKAGLTRAVGVSNYSEKRMRAAHKRLAEQGVPLAANQVHYNLLYRLPEQNGVLDACRELGVSLVAYSPLAQGMLSGKYSPENPPPGPRGRLYTAEWLRKAQPLLDALGAVGEERGKTRTQVALNWLLCQDDCVLPIPGGKSADQVEDFRGALGWHLDAGEVEELRRLSMRVPAVQGFPAENL